MLRSVLVLLLAAGGCGGGDGGSWQLVHEGLPGALLSVWGTSANDVWAVGADARDGTGPLVLHYDGSEWTRVPTGQTSGALWWVHGFPGGPIFMGGSGGVILRYEGGAFTRMTTPGTETVFGIWGSAPSDVWAVGGASESAGGFVWRLRGDAWEPEPSLPAEVQAGAAVWKVFGRRADDVWFVGSNGVSLRWDGMTLTPGDTGVRNSLFTVHANASRYAAVGGLASGVLVEYEGGVWKDATPAEALGLAGVCLSPDDGGVAVGNYGGVYARRRDGTWEEEDLGFLIDGNLHGVWIDPEGGVWAVGGQTFNPSLTEGVLIHRGDRVAQGAM